jgi:glycosyltransferase involved in cell wall biosynthesis
MNSQRVAIQLVSTGGFYGAERTLLEIAAYVRDRDWQSHVVALEGPGAAEIVKRATAERLDVEAFVSSGRLGVISMMKRLRSLLQRYPRAVLHSHGYKPDMLLALMQAPLSLPCVATCHGWYSRSHKQKLLEALDKRALRRFDQVVAVSEVIEQDLTQSGVPAEKVSLIMNGISALQPSEDARARIRAEMGVIADERIIVQIGRIGYPKRNELLVEGVAALPQPFSPYIWFIGEGDQQNAVMDLARRRGLQNRVRFCGYRSDIADILAAADLLAVTSDTEGLPITILEAMSVCCPVVSTRVGAIPRVLKDGRDAWLVPTGDSVALTSALEEVLGKPELARQRALNAHGEYVRAHSREAMGAKYLELYEAVWRRRNWS